MLAQIGEQFAVLNEALGEPCLLSRVEFRKLLGFDAIALTHA